MAHASSGWYCKLCYACDGLRWPHSHRMYFNSPKKSAKFWACVAIKVLLRWQHNDDNTLHAKISCSQAHLDACQVEGVNKHSQVDSKNWNAAHSAAMNAHSVQSILHFNRPVSVCIPTLKKEQDCAYSKQTAVQGTKLMNKVPDWEGTACRFCTYSPSDSILGQLRVAYCACADHPAWRTSGDVHGRKPASIAWNLHTKDTEHAGTPEGCKCTVVRRVGRTELLPCCIGSYHDICRQGA